jgi:subtilisin family serine protease
MTVEANLQWPVRSATNITTRIAIDNTYVGPAKNTVYNTTYGYGLVDAAKTISAIKNMPIDDVANLGGSKWFLDMIKAPEVWAKNFTGQDVVVAIVDTGIDYNHTELVDNIWTNPNEIPDNNIDDDNNGFIDDVRGWDFVQADNTPMDLHSHGTHIAGIISAVAPNVKLMAVRSADATGSFSLSSAARGIYYAANNGAQIINLSLGGTIPVNTLKSAIAYAVTKGCICIIAAGNYGGAVPIYPAIYTDTLVAIAVGSVGAARKMSTFSNKSGPNVLEYVVAPGASIYSTMPGNRYGIKSGTSMATPMVAGIAALMLSANPLLTPAEIERLISDYSSPLP